MTRYPVSIFFLLTLLFGIEAPSAQAAQLEDAAEAVILITAYEDVPVYAVEYQYRDGVLRADRTKIGAIETPVSSGSGFFASTDGYIITNNHVVEAIDATYTVFTGDKELSAHVVYRDPEHDIAVLKASGRNHPTLPLGSSEELAVGDPVLSIGNPLGTYIDSVSAGKVHSLDASIFASGANPTDAEALGGLIEASTDLYPGDSGGPLLNERGEVVGVNVATALDARLGYAVPAEIAIEALNRAR
jgi:S1-C subfamily serine protease